MEHGTHMHQFDCPWYAEDRDTHSIIQEFRTGLESGSTFTNIMSIAHDNMKHGWVACPAKYTTSAILLMSDTVLISG